MNNHAIIKWNNGNLAILCSKCRVIIKEGKDFTEEELIYFRDRRVDLSKYLPQQYCENCKNN